MLPLAAGPTGEGGQGSEGAGACPHLHRRLCPLRLLFLAPQFSFACHLCMPQLGSLLRGCSCPITAPPKASGARRAHDGDLVSGTFYGYQARVAGGTEGWQWAGPPQHPPGPHTVGWDVGHGHGLTPWRWCRPSVPWWRGEPAPLPPGTGGLAERAGKAPFTFLKFG